MPDVKKLELNYQLSEDGKTVMLLSPDEEEAMSSPECELIFRCDSDQITARGPMSIIVRPLMGPGSIRIDYTTDQLRRKSPKGSANISKGKHKQTCFDINAHSEWKKVQGCKFANEEALDFVTKNLEEVNFRDYNDDLISRLKEEEAATPLLSRTEKGMKAQRYYNPGKRQDDEKLGNLADEHAEALGQIRDEFVELLKEKYLAQPVAKKLPFKMRKSKDEEFIEIIKRDPESMQSALTKLFYWIMDKLRGVSNFEIKAEVIPAPEMGKYDLQVALYYGKNEHKILESSHYGLNDTHKTHNKFRLKGSLEALQDFEAAMNDELNLKQIVECYKNELHANAKIGDDNFKELVSDAEKAQNTILDSVKESLQESLQESMKKIQEEKAEKDKSKESKESKLEKLRGTISSKFGKGRKYTESIVQQDIAQKGESGGPGRR
ncbi:hypothetical protein RLOatenuis_4570 [Rickettsiales bacterium]|nr:hypothetical protein RLOatenuis_4570 [Rickettsiales bacterium]